MKRRFLLIAAIISISLVGCGRNAENSIVEESSVETSEPLETATPEVEPTPDPLPESSIDYKDIDPEIHATYNESTGEIIVDETMARTMLMNSPLFEKRAITDKYVKCVLEVYLDGYYTGQFDGDAWYRFAATGDTTYLNLELSDEELASKIEQKHESLLKAEAEQVAAAEQLAAEQKKQDEEDNQERLYKTLAETMGLTVEEVKALIAANEAAENTKGSSGNTSADSTPASTTDNSTNNIDSPYISDKNGYKVGQVYAFDAYEIKYLGEDRWYDEWNQTYYTAIANDNGGFTLRTDEYLSRTYAKEGETPVSERLGYNVGDYITCQSLGFSFRRIYDGNDIWHDDNRPGSQMRAYIDANGNIGFD